MSEDTLKNGYTINPETGRPIKINGKVYRRLLKKALIPKKPEEYAEEQKYDISELNNDQVELKKQMLAKENPDHHIIRNTSKKNKNKLIKRQKQLKEKDIASFVSKRSMEIFNEHKDEIMKLKQRGITDSEIENKIEKIILDELLNNPYTEPPSRDNEQIEASQYYIEDP